MWIASHARRGSFRPLLRAGTSQRDVPTYDEDAAAQRPYLKPTAAGDVPTQNVR